MKTLLKIILINCFYIGVSQETQPKISVSFSNLQIEDALNSIEQVSSYRFYYLNEWFVNETVSGNYEDVYIENILDEIFQKTTLNYFVLNDTQVILTRNNIIYDELPEGFFRSEEQINIDLNPVFYREQHITAKTRLQTIQIGKENKLTSQKNFILRGTVTNARDASPIPNMTVLIRNSNIGVQTNNDGFYEIRIPTGLNVLETHLLGFEDTQRKVIIYNEGQLNFTVNESYELLNEVVVEANLDENVEEAITGSSKIGSEESKNIPLVLGERDILKVATTLPGITTAGEGSAGFNVRGGKTDQNLILIDNAVIYNPSHFFGIFQALNPFTTSGVNIYKGSIPTEYGGRLSSVFDISTIDSNNKKFSGGASIGPVTNNIFLDIPIVKGKSGLVLGGRGTYSDWILRSLDDESLKNSKASFYDIVVKYTHKITDKDNLKVTGYYSKDNFSITSDSLFKYSNRMLALNWDHQFNEKNKGSLVLANSQYKFNINFDSNSSNDFDLGYMINDTELKLKMKNVSFQKHSITYGLSSKLYKIRPGEIDPIGVQSIINPLKIPEERAVESAIFISDNFKINDKLLLDVGLRYSMYISLGKSSQRIYEDDKPKNEGTLVRTQTFDENEIIETYGGPEVRVSARYLLTDDFSVKASFNNTYQYIHTLSNNTTASPTDIWKLSDLNIKPQEANQLSLGFYKNFDRNNYELSLEGYYKKSKNILDYKVGADLLLNETVETEVLQGKGKAYGIELLIKKNNGKLNGWLGYTYSRSFIKLNSEFAEERVNGGDYFPSNFDKPHDISLVANYKLTKRFSLSTNFTYQTGRPVTYPVGSYFFGGSEVVLYSDRNKYRIPDYYRLDLSFNIEGNHKIKKFAHSFWSLSVYNVLGRNNPYSVFFVTENSEVKGYQSSIFSIPIPSITYNFRF